ncbi:uncharacterized protein GGS22DRAFT_151983 [Annulohypoxylon maeteangense]|uniref:uncharacterized protein n=1 Tax=Annulohypoxylon maeteangense TaxID=1927788 RepID=UPI002008CF0D|nr:uncharacterized protein GGS22DRAFT_151983 [Annulohypoxylon maeteangense]KAI0888620.1 hypothetical protein GGS22DRAFT_151983 [Annulohypoxylon maeteangense]
MYRGRAPGYSRGRGRGRGHAFRSNNWRDPSVPEKKEDVVNYPLGRLVMTMTLGNISGYGIHKNDAKITDCKYVASYSLVDSSSPRIILPGQPAFWEPPSLPSQLPRDSDKYFRDQNGARFPEYPMQPSVQSIFALNEGFDSENVDIMCCASSLGNILRFIRSVDATFRFDVEMIGNTLFLISNSRDQVIPGVHGHGMTFLENFTTYPADLKESKSHQRIISYSFGGLKFLVRFECDGHLGDSKDTSTATDGLNVSQTPVPDSIAVEAAGVAVPQNSIIEIKTRSQRQGQEIEMNEHYPRLWLRQIPNFIVAYHIKGSFEDVQNKNVQQDLYEWESAHETELRKFASILQQLIVAVKRAGNLKLEICRTGLGPLELREQIGTPREVLPNGWKDMWAKEPKDKDRDGTSHLGDGNGDDDDDNDDDESYPSFSSRNNRSSESDSSEDDDNYSVDYTACGLDCGYCGHCG